jgi:hypothetical protein
MHMMHVKKVLLGAGTGALLFAAAITPAFAAGNGDGSNASACGAVHGAFADVNGNFGFLGAVGGTPGYHNGAVGQDAGATGYNNSHTGCQS